MTRDFARYLTYCVPLLSALLATATCLCQPSSPADLWLLPQTTEFTVIQQSAESYFATHGGADNPYHKHWKRWEWLMENRLDDDGHITNYAARNMKADMAWRSREYQRSVVQGGHWNVLAPTDGYILGAEGNAPGLGRVNVIAFHPTDPNVVFAGTPAGGLWKTTNAGVSWLPLTDGLPRIGISGIAVHHTYPNIIYILTGDGDGGTTKSVGVLKSFDGGLNWRMTGLSWDANDLIVGYKLLMHPTDPDTLLAATTEGLYRTTDGATSWTLEQPGSFRDVEFKPDDPSIVYACTKDAFYRSVNHGDTWAASNTGLPSGEHRAALAVSVDDPNYIYYLAGPGGTTGFFKGLYRSEDAGLTWSLRTNTPNILDASLDGMSDCPSVCGQSTYDLAIAVDPNDANEVITGGINVWRDESNGGTNMELISYRKITTAQAQGLEYTHADIHELVFQDDNTVWCGSDGGIFRSIDDGLTWEDRSSAGPDDGLQIMQFYRIADYPGNANLLIGGTQDNGSMKWDGGNDVTHFNGGDGADCMINYLNPLIQYHEQQRGALYKSTDGSVSFTYINPSNSNGAFVTPLDMDPSNPDEIWAAYIDTIYRSDDAGATWSAMIPQLTGESFRSLHCAPAVNIRVYAASRNYMYRSNDNGSTWTNITGTLPVGAGAPNITMITTDNNNANEVWVTLSGYSDGNKVFYSLNSGVTWINVSGSLPNVPVNCIVYDDYQTNDDALYIGTDIGVFYRDETLSDWVPFRNGLPTVIVTDLEVHVGAQKVRAATLGRGIWESDIYGICPSTWTLTEANLPGSGSQGYRVYQSSGDITSTRTIQGGVGTAVYYQATSEVKLLDGFQAKAGIDVFRAMLTGCTSGIPD